MSEGPSDVVLAHYGVLGMKWGRRKQADGSYKKTGRSAKREEFRKKSGERHSLKTEIGRARLATNAGLTAVGFMTSGPVGAVQVANMIGGYEISRSAGIGVGSSVAIGMLGGTLGGLAASEIAVRKESD